MATTRRNFLYASASTAAVSESLAFQPDAALPALSKSVLSATEASIGQLRTEARARRMTARSVRRAHTSLSIFFDHLDETGHTAHIQRLLQEKELLDQPLDYQQLTLVRDRYTAATGTPVTDAEFQALVTNNDTMWPKFHALHKHGGIKAVRAAILAGLDNGASRIEQDERNGLAGANIGGARLRPAHMEIWQDCGSYACDGGQSDGYGTAPSTAWDICGAIGIAGVYVSTWGLMDAIGAISVFAVGPVGWAVITLLFAVAGLMCM